MIVWNCPHCVEGESCPLQFVNNKLVERGMRKLKRNSTSEIDQLLLTVSVGIAIYTIKELWP